VQSLLNVDNQEIGLENLEGMLKILPDSNEVFSLLLKIKLTIKLNFFILIFNQD
jgi:hypothetical protein